MKYLKNEIILLQSINIKRDDIREALNNILDGYNRVFNMAVQQQEYINRKSPAYAREMEDNLKLLERNSFLEEEYKRFKGLYKNQLEHIKTLEKQLKQFIEV